MLLLGHSLVVSFASPAEDHAPPAKDWRLVAHGMAKTSLGLSAVNGTTLFLAGGGGSIANGPFVAVSTDSGSSWSALDGVDESKMLLCNVVRAAPSGLVVASGVTLGKEAVARSSTATSSP